MSAREHRCRRLAVRQKSEPLIERIDCGNENRARGGEEARIAQIIEILGGAAEMHQFQYAFARAGGEKLLPHVVFDGLDVVIYARLYLFYSRPIGL